MKNKAPRSGAELPLPASESPEDRYAIYCIIGESVLFANAYCKAEQPETDPERARLVRNRAAREFLADATLPELRELRARFRETAKVLASEACDDARPESNLLHTSRLIAEERVRSISFADLPPDLDDEDLCAHMDKKLSEFLDL